jgi:hypothetical protein
VVGRSGESSGSVTVLGFTHAADPITSIAIRDLHFVDRSVDLVLGGVIECRRDGAALLVDVALDVAGQVDADVTGVAIDGHLRREYGRVFPVAASTVAVDSVGSLDVGGSWAVGDQPAGSLALTGAGALTVDVDRPIANGCFAALLDGTPTSAACRPLPLIDRSRSSRRRRCIACSGGVRRFGRRAPFTAADTPVA